MKGEGRKSAWLLVVVVSLLVALVATACGAPSSAPAPAATQAPAAAPAATKAPAAPQAPAAAAPEVKPVTLRFTSPLPPPPYSAAVIAEWWGSEVEKKTNGKVKFQFFHGGTLSKPREELDAVKSGLADAGFITLPYYPTQLALGNFSYAVPFGPSKATMMLDATQKVYAAVPALTEEIEKNNQKIIFFRVLGDYDVVSKSPLRTLDDFKGKKLASIGDYHPKIVAAAGATPVNMPVAERFQALQTGVIDGSVLPLDLSANSKFQDVAKNASRLGLGSAYSTVVTINKEVWDKIPADTQKIILDVGAEAGKKLAQETDSYIEKAITDMKAAGVTIVELPAAEKVKWAEKLPDFPAEWARELNKKGLPATQVVQTYLDVTTKAGFKHLRQWGTK